MNNKFTKFFLVVFITMISFVSFAQVVEPGGDGGDQEQPEAAPISDYIPLALLIGTYIGYILFIKKKADNTNK